MSDKNRSIADLETRINKAKEQVKNGDESSEGRKSARGGMHHCVELLAGVIAGLLVGHFLDKWLNTQPLFLVICFVLGFAGAVRNIIRSN